MARPRRTERVALGTAAHRRHAGARPHLRGRRSSMRRAGAATRASTQVANVAHLPGILCCSLAMPDIHFGYGFPIGGVAAFDVDDGVVSPGGVGYDINCGVPAARHRPASASDVAGKIKPLVDQLFRDVPSGVGSSGAIAKLSRARAGAAAGARAPAGRCEQGYGSRGRPGPHRGRRRPARRRPGRGERAGLHPRPGPGGHPGLGQPLPGGAGGRRGLRPGGGRRLRPARGADHRHDPLRLARLRLPGLRRLPGRSWPRPAGATASTCPTGSWPAPRSARRRAGATWRPWPAPPTTPGPTGR